MAFALIVAGGGTTTRGQQTAIVFLTIEVRPDRAPQVVCVGQTSELLVRARLDIISPDTRVLGSHMWPYVKPRGTSSNPRIAKLQRQKDPYKVNYGVVEPYQGERFDLTGVKPGTGRLTFQATQPPLTATSPDTVSTGRLRAKTTIDFKVVKCDYEVSAVHVWSIPATDASFSDTVITAAMRDVRVVADDEGRLSGRGVLDWVAGYDAAGFKTSLTVAPSGVDITGKVGDDGQVTLQFAYEAGTSKWHSRRIGNDPTKFVFFRVTYPIEPSAISLDVSADGGTTGFAQALAIDAGSYGRSSTEGQVVITVEPVEDEAVASTGTIAGHARAAVPGRGSAER